MSRPPLSVRQKSILDFVVSFFREHGYPPTLREIGKSFGIKSTNGVSDHLRALERNGYIERSRTMGRAIRPIGDSFDADVRVDVEREEYRKAFLKLAPWCEWCADTLAAVVFSADDVDATFCTTMRAIYSCDHCAAHVAQCHPKRIVEDLPWAALARKEK